MTLHGKMLGFRTLAVLAALLASCAADDEHAPGAAAPVTLPPGSTTSSGDSAAPPNAPPRTPVPGLRAEYFDGYHDLGPGPRQNPADQKDPRR